VYNIQEISQKIKDECKLKGIIIKKVLVDCKLSTSTVSNMSNGRMPRIDTVAKIADYLDCSVDYLLGRSDDIPVLISNAKDNSVAVNQSDSGTVTIKNGKERELTKQEQDLLRIYNNATTRQQIKLIDFALSIEDEMKSSDK